MTQRDDEQANRELDWATGRELERKDAEIVRLCEHLAAAGVTLTTASMIIKRLGSEADAALIAKVADQVAAALNANGQGTAR